jgi:hypothetical protein
VRYDIYIYIYVCIYMSLGVKGLTNCSRFRLPRGLRRRSTVYRLLGLRVRIPPEARLSVMSVVCCQVEVSETG